MFQTVSNSSKFFQLLQTSQFLHGKIVERTYRSLSIWQRYLYISLILARTLSPSKWSMLSGFLRSASTFFFFSRSPLPVRFWAVKSVSIKEDKLISHLVICNHRTKPKGPSWRPSFSVPLPACGRLIFLLTKRSKLLSYLIYYLKLLSFIT